MTRPLDLGSGTAMSHFAQIRPDPVAEVGARAEAGGEELAERVDRERFLSASAYRRHMLVGSCP